MTDRPTDRLTDLQLFGSLSIQFDSFWPRNSWRSPVTLKPNTADGGEGERDGDEDDGVSQVRHSIKSEHVVVCKHRPHSYPHLLSLWTWDHWAGTFLTLNQQQRQKLLYGFRVNV